jgi:peptidyl-prolyl cis-trans isomerase B (cyclophilin B)
MIVIRIFMAAATIALAACAPANKDAGTTAQDTTMASASQSQTTATTSAAQTTTASIPSAPKAVAEEKPMSSYEGKIAELHTSSGEIDVRFFPDVAPKHVKNFLDLAEKGFYNGTKFHRVIPGFMIQGGDPNTISGSPSSWGTGGSGTNVPAEFSKIKHTRGILSMARSNDPNSASSQFFLMVADYPSLDGKYSVFGEVTKGMDVADKIVSAPTGPNDRPNNPTTINKIVVRDARPDEKGPTPK